jgi:hypothetical protein
MLVVANLAEGARSRGDPSVRPVGNGGGAIRTSAMMVVSSKNL